MRFPVDLPLMNLFNNPQAFVRDLLLFIPAFLIALVLHEVAHGYVALRCGDPTAKVLGRLSLNPMKHLDPIGTLMIVFVGFGWAKPVPVNGINFKKPRRDSIFVSIAGITTNLLLFLLFSSIMYIVLGFALTRLGSFPPGYAVYAYQNAIGASLLIEMAFGTVPSMLYEVVIRIVLLNFTLACFNLLPVPPLDGSHLFSNIFLNRSNLFQSQTAAQTGYMLVLILIFTGWFSKAVGFLLNGAFGALGSLAAFVARAAGL